MFRSKGVPIGKIIGVPIYLDWSWFLVFALATWSLATGYFPAEFQGWPTSQYWIVGAVTALLLFVSVLLHELGHAAMANVYGVPVQRITLFIFGGVAQLGGESRTAMAEFMIAVIGPVVSFALAGFFYVLRPFVTAFEPVSALTEYLAIINFSLAAFNLIPGFPLDGGRVFRAIVWAITKNLSRATVIAVEVGRLVAFGFLAFGVWRMINGAFSNGLWLVFIGWFLRSAADSQLRYQIMRDTLADHTVSQAMSRNYVSVPGGTDLQTLVDHHILGSGVRNVVVEDNGQAAGLLTVHQIKEVPRERWPETTVRQAMSPEDCCETVRPETGLWEALEKMDRDGYNQLLVKTDGRMVGMLNRGDVITFLRTAQELGV